LLSRVELDESVKDDIRAYGGTYLYYITLRTVPSPATGDGGLNSLGVHFSFQVTPVDGRYTYPLGTGKVWGNPISLTRVYVINGRGLQVDLNYPEYGERLSSEDVSWRLSGYIGDINSSAWNIIESSDPNQLLSRITYLKANPDTDIVVSVSKKNDILSLFGMYFELYWRFTASAVLPILLFVGPLILWSFYFQRFLGDLVDWSSRLKKHVHILIYFILNSITSSFISLFFFWWYQLI